jgi:hypothetical protein
MNINIWYEINQYQSGIYTHIAAADKLYQYFCETYPDINFTAKDYLNIPVDFNSNKHLLKLTKRPTSFHYIIIENPDNGKYFVISHADKGGSEVTYFPDYENLVELFPCVGMQKDDFKYEIIDTKYTPVSHVAHILVSEREAERLYNSKSKRIISDKPYFRSCAYLFRKWLYENDNRFDIKCERIGEIEFMEEMNQHAINIDLNCIGGVSDRTVNAMALGTALIRTKLPIEYHNPLIPNYHFAQVDCDDLSDYPRLADAFIDKYEELKKSPEYVKFLSENGRKYYEENNTLEAHLNILKKVINFNKLK